VNIKSACTTKTSLAALNILVKDIKNATHQCTVFEEYEKTLNNSPTLKQLGKTLYLFNSASNYGPKSC
jgi:hypothetical protein